MISPDMARKSLGVLSERVEQPRGLSNDEADELVFVCDYIVGLLEQVWHMIQRTLDRGSEVKAVTFILKESIDALDLGIQTFQSAIGKVNGAGLPAAQAGEVASSLQRATQRATGLRDEASALLHSLDRPLPAVDPSSLRADRGERDAPGYVSLKDLAARMLPRENA
jgi:hypothetical protein